MSGDTFVRFADIFADVGRAGVAASRGIQRERSGRGRFRSFNIHSLENIEMFHGPKTKSRSNTPLIYHLASLIFFSQLNGGVTDSTYLLRARR